MCITWPYVIHMLAVCSSRIECMTWTYVGRMLAKPKFTYLVVGLENPFIWILFTPLGSNHFLDTYVNLDKGILFGNIYIDPLRFSSSKIP